MSLTRRQFLIRAGIASVAGPAVLATGGSVAFANFGETPESPEGSLSLRPRADVNLVGSEHTVIATRRPRQAGAIVHFEVSDGPNSGDAADVATDDLGRATFTYTGADGEGLDVISASALDPASGERIATATKEWVAISAITAVALSPASAVNEVGSEHELRATLTPRVDAVPVHFAVLVGPNAGLSATVMSDHVGRASFAYIGDGGLGTDGIVAWVDANENGVLDDADPQAAATKEWVESPESPESPESAESTESAESPESSESPESRGD